MGITISHLTKTFGSKTALDNVSIEIPNGMFGLLGRNGADKTTLMRILATLLTKNSGDVRLLGIPVEKTKQIREIVGYLPQTFSMYPNMTVYEAMDYLAVLSEISRENRKSNIIKLLDTVSLFDSQKLRVKTLSGGMIRRLGIAQAIMNDPKVLIVDEPTARLDPEERIRFRNLLSQIAKDRIVILSTHITGDIETTCENLAILEQGKIIYKGTAANLKSLASNKVYTLSAPKSELNELKDKYAVASIISSGNNVTLRVLTDNKPNAQVSPCAPTIEDGYILLVGGK